MPAAIISGIIIALVLILGTIWMGRSASKSTEEAVHSVSLFYLNELASRREQVVAATLKSHINNLKAAVGLVDQVDLSDEEHIEALENRLEELYGLERFAFVDSDGLIYTSEGTQENIDEFPFDYLTLDEPVVQIKEEEGKEKNVVIAIPVEGLSINDRELKVCFIEISMQNMLEGISLTSEDNDTTFCNIYTKSGVALTDMVLGGLASENNLLEAMQHAEYEKGYSFDQMIDTFSQGKEGVVSFTYNGIQETLYYEPIAGTDWMLTYLIRESMISDQISSVTDSIVRRSLLQTILTVLVLLALFVIIFIHMRRTSKIILEKETAEAENRVKQEELEQRIALQEQILEQEKQRAQQDNMITALSRDYRSVYYIDLDNNKGICYRKDQSQKDSIHEGDHFPFYETFASYAESCVAESYRESFLSFIDPENIRKSLETELVITFRYLTVRDGAEIYEMLRMAGVRNIEDRKDHMIHAVGVGITNVDKETREALAKNEALSNALNAAEEASKAKTIFLSNMSHEIRTPMNAIIGLDNIALNDEDISEKTRDYLEKIGSSAQHLLTIINDILDMSRIESGRLIIKNEEFYMPKMLEQINTMISGQCGEKGLEYNCHIEGHLDDYYIGDDIKLRQVLINILGNAVKFTPSGGSVDFIVKRLAEYDGKTTLQFEIKDTGIGISKEYLPQIFDAFSQEDSSSTNKYGSSGLGLAITKNIVEMMNGKLDVESEKGVGSIFTVTLTLLDSSRRADGFSVDEISPQDLSILVIDDDPIALEHAKLVLEKAGITAEIASSGQEAVELVRLRHARRNPYNLILVDWKMPEMDGVETTRKIREIVGGESAIVILTAYKWDDVLEEASNAGVDSFISKPLFASNVIEEFRKTLERKGLNFSKTHKADLKGRKVLLAEDVEVNSQIMMMVLSMREISTDLAENGKVAVQKFAESPVGYYDAILMDMRMPEMDGLTATQKIRELDRPDSKTIPMIALTANAFDEDVQRSLQAGLNAHLSKPVQPELLFETLETLIKD